MKSRLVRALFFLVVLIPARTSAQRDFFNAVSDTVDLYTGTWVTKDLMANDVFSSNDSILVMAVIIPSPLAAYTMKEHLSGGVYRFFLQSGCNGDHSGIYILRRKGTADTSNATILFRAHDYSFDSLCINNVNAKVFSDNNNFIGTDFGKFEVPKFSGKSTIFLNTLWIGGITGDSTLCLAGQKYGQGPTGGAAHTKFDFFVGPVMDSLSYSTHTDSAWYYVWNLKKSEVEFHKTHWTMPGYLPIHDIMTWPGNGNTALGQAQQLAPFYDLNGDGYYNPLAGDFPIIKGDQALFYIFNDDRNIHTETLGNKMKIEVHAMAYAFDLPDDSAFNHTVFLNYKIFNRSQHAYRDTYIGNFTDFDIGYSGDDYLGCDVQRGSFFGYNGPPVDGSGQPEAYGAHPPAQAVTVLGGPFMDADGLDNPRYDNLGNQLCNESINGTCFGDAVADNERMGLTNFLFSTNVFPGVPTYWPEDYAPDYYDKMRSIWYNGTHLVYGGFGTPLAGGYGPDCHFMYPGLSDSLNWGVGCQPPNGPEDWSEFTAGFSPGDRRGLGSMGPFTFKPGDVQEIDLAFTWARDYDDSVNRSVPLLMQYVDSIRHAYTTNILPGGGSFNGTGDHRQTLTESIRIYPNPASGQINVALPKSLFEMVNVTICDNGGREVYTREVNPAGNKISLDLPGLKSGLYFIRVQSVSFSGSAKVSIVK